MPAFLAILGTNEWSVSPGNVFISNKTGLGIRKLTPRECLNFQGFPKSFKFPDDMPVSQRYKQAGNAVTVTLIKKIADIISNSLD